MIQPDSTVDLSLQSKNRPGALIIAQLELKLDLNQGIRCQDPKEWKQGPLLFSWYSDEMHWRFKRVSRFPPNLSKAQRLITDIAPDTLDKSPAKRRWGCIRTRKVWTPSCSEPLGLLFVEATQNQYSNTVLDIYSQGNIVSIDRIGHVGLWYLVIYYIYWYAVWLQSLSVLSYFEALFRHSKQWPHSGRGDPKCCKAASHHF